MFVSKLIREAYAVLVTDRKRDVTFVILLTFVPTFVLARLTVYLFPHLFAHVGGVHIHHLTYGIIILAIAGYAGLVVHQAAKRRWVAGLYGIGLALAFDEFGIWLRLEDNYYLRQSYDAMLLLIALLINIVYFRDFWSRLAKRLVGHRPAHD